MFSIRVDKGDIEGHSMYSCRTYDVLTKPGERPVRLRLHPRDKDWEVQEIEIPMDGKAFIMNEHGRTIATIPARAEAKA